MGWICGEDTSKVGGMYDIDIYFNVIICYENNSIGRYDVGFCMH